MTEDQVQQLQTLEIRVKFCGFCGTPTERYLIDFHRYDEDTGERATAWRTRCPAWRWWKPWHHHDGLVRRLTPPPTDRG